MSRLFISHAGENIAEAVAICDWLKESGWDNFFLDQARQGGIDPGQRWERALHQAAYRCEAVIFLVSRAWLASHWCRKEFSLARGLGRRLFPVLIEPLGVGALDAELTETWQLADLCSGEDHRIFRVQLPVSQSERHVTFSQAGLEHLRNGLVNAGLDPRFFGWPPAHDPDRPPYRGLRPLEADDAGIFFGRDAHIIEALARLDGLRQSAAPRLLVILGASGAGKSSFLRAGLFPRLRRNDRHFLPLPIIRPERAAISGSNGLLAALEGAFAEAELPISQLALRAAVENGAPAVRELLRALAVKRTPPALSGGAPSRPPTLVLSIDQGEELFHPDGQRESGGFLALLGALLEAEAAAGDDVPALIALFTIRSDSYEQLQRAKELQDLHQDTLALPPMLKGSYGEVIKGPAQRLGPPRRLRIDDALAEELLVDIEQGDAGDASHATAGGGDAKDALPLLAFTLERLYLAFRGRAVGEAGGLTLTVADYAALGGLHGAINAAVASALDAADKDPAVPRDDAARQALLRRAFIPHLAGVDPDTRTPRRRVARRSDLPAEALPLLEHLVEQRLLVTDIARETGEQTIEPAHEALLRQWSRLQEWLDEDAELLILIDGVKRAAKDWAKRSEDPTWLAHGGKRLKAVGRLCHERPDLGAGLKPAEQRYLRACRRRAERMLGARALVAVSFALVVGLGAMGWTFESDLKEWFVRVMREGPYRRTEVEPYVLTPEQERALKPGDAFKECAHDCPVMVVVPPGRFTMGSPKTDRDRQPNEEPQQPVTIAARFAVGEFEVTFDQWDACAAVGGCPQIVDDNGFGRGSHPVINVSWTNAKTYVAWLSRVTAKPYRLLSEAEWEYAARGRAVSSADDPPYAFGDDDPGRHAWYAANADARTHPVGQKAANRFGLHDMLGNVFEWVEDCAHPSYQDAPDDGSAWVDRNCPQRIARGGSWLIGKSILRSAYREPLNPPYTSSRLGFRVARTLDARAVGD
jgi:formylglycine-generating enzyme required for sulfatase activity